MYIIFIHVTGIALLEILFYFFYIGPIESKLLQNSMKHIVITTRFFVVQSLSQQSTQDQKPIVVFDFSPSSCDHDCSHWWKRQANQRERLCPSPRDGGRLVRKSLRSKLV